MQNTQTPVEYLNIWKVSNCYNGHVLWTIPTVIKILDTCCSYILYNLLQSNWLAIGILSTYINQIAQKTTSGLEQLSVAWGPIRQTFVVQYPISFELLINWEKSSLFIDECKGPQRSLMGHISQSEDGIEVQGQALRSLIKLTSFTAMNASYFDWFQRDHRFSYEPVWLCENYKHKWCKFTKFLSK